MSVPRTNTQPGLFLCALSRSSCIASQPQSVCCARVCSVCVRGVQGPRQHSMQRNELFKLKQMPNNCMQALIRFSKSFSSPCRNSACSLYLFIIFRLALKRWRAFPCLLDELPKLHRRIFFFSFFFIVSFSRVPSKGDKKNVSFVWCFPLWRGNNYFFPFSSLSQPLDGFHLFRQKGCKTSPPVLQWPQV